MSSVVVQGRILYLLESPELLRAQLAGEAVTPARQALVAALSTDEIAPGWACYYYDETLGRYALVGLRGGTIEPDAVRAGGFEVLVSGRSTGCGSSRETAPYALRSAGIRVLIAESFERIFEQNCHNVGLFTATDFSLLDRIERGEPVELEAFTRGLDPISQGVVRSGGLFGYSRGRLEGRISSPRVATPKRPMTMCEKIIAAHTVAGPDSRQLGVTAVAPGDAVFIRTDVRYTHDYVTAMAEALFRAGYGAGARVSDPASVFAFRDHLTLLETVMPEEHRRLNLHHQARSLKLAQEDFCRRQGIRLFGEVVSDGGEVGSEAICHNKILEDIALPGQVVVGTDSHTCMVGALGCLAFGIGSTDMAAAWFSRDVRTRVPATIRIVLEGRLAAGVCAKDVMLYLLSREPFVSGGGIGRVLEFGGAGLSELPLDERATLTNMAVEAGAWTGILVPDRATIEEVAKARGLLPSQVARQVVEPDAEASYERTLHVDLARVPVMVARPGNPKNGVPLSELRREHGGDIAIDIAYGGSCTGGKAADMDMYAQVLGAAVRAGRRVASGVELYIQFGSQRIRRYAEQRGYFQVFREAGARLLEPSCGACIRAGPGVSFRPDQVTVSAQNRNFPGRSGPGQVFLASPLVVAASAIAGKLCGPHRL